MSRLKTKINLPVELQNKRNSNIEILWFVLIFLICVCPMLVYGFDIKDMGTTDFGYLEMLIYSICIPSVHLLRYSKNTCLNKL